MKNRNLTYVPFLLGGLYIKTVSCLADVKYERDAILLLNMFCFTSFLNVIILY